MIEWLLLPLIVIEGRKVRAKAGRLAPPRGPLTGAVDGQGAGVGHGACFGVDDRQGGLARGGLPQPKIREDRKFLNPPLLAAVEGQASS